MELTEEQKKLADELGFTNCPKCGTQSVTDMGAHVVCLYCGLIVELNKK